MSTNNTDAGGLSAGLQMGIVIAIFASLAVLIMLGRSSVSAGGKWCSEEYQHKPPSCVQHEAGH
tara:strand:- start:18364 stop:18555 length:192 start_codon:yes stop_codon:yes gene_type:complete